MTNPKETYLGDGLYAFDDGYSIGLRAPRGNGNDHIVYLEPAVLLDFFKYVEKARNLKIVVTRNTNQQEGLNHDHS